MSDFLTTSAFFLKPTSFALVLLGTTLGVVVGSIPGLTGAMLIALTLPLTFALGGEDALALLVSMYVGSVSGGLISATLLRMPGTPASMMTTLDGYPMAKRGEAGRALGLGIGASLVGGLISWVFLIALSKPMAEVSTKLGSFDFFSLVLVALVLIASVSGRSLINGMFAGMLGIFFAMPGTSPATGEVRLTLGMHELDDGFKLLPVLIGLFAVTQVVNEIKNLGRKTELVAIDSGKVSLKLGDLSNQIVNLIRSSFIGTWIGILPGIGANIGSVVAYSVAKNTSKTPEEFGKGCDEGIVASESANNATVGGALIPLISLGIPGSVIDAILLGAFVIHGLQPGPLLFSQNPQAVHVIMGSMLLANILMFGMMWISIRWLAKLADIPRWLLIPTVLVFCVVGSFALGNRMFDVWVMLAFGGIGLVMDLFKLPLAPFVIGFVLSPLAEEHFCAGLMQSNGSYLPLVTRPVSLTFLVVAVGVLVWSLRRRSSLSV